MIFPKSSGRQILCLFLATIHSLRSLEQGPLTIGEFCSTDSECVEGAQCLVGRCSCFSTHIAIEKFCWRKIPPEESGCSFDAQCGAVWPGAVCLTGTCKCPFPMVSAPTKEGTVCHLIGECPTNGRNALLFDRITGAPSTCHFLNDQDRSKGFIGCDDFPDVYDCIDGLCCPSRALTCIQPRDVGRGTSPSLRSTRWYHNPVSHTCQTFEFSGVDGNSNNFQNKEHCEFYCVSRCPRGQPLSIDDSGMSISSTSCSQPSQQCDSERFECTQVDDSVQQCCPNKDFICSEWGGVGSGMYNHSQVDDRLSYSPGSTTAGRQGSTTRWYWSRQRYECVSFVYFGQGGNFNNFLSKEHCNEFCSPTLCPLGLPLRTSTGAIVSCSPSDRCPTSHTCHQGRCCQTASSLCNEPLSKGVRCHETSSSRFWYNASLGACQVFSYRGCQGNSNSFPSLESCHQTCGGVEAQIRCPRGEPLSQRRCSMDDRSAQCPVGYECFFDGTSHGCCPSTETVCALPKEDGKPCGQRKSIRWFFDPSSNTCRSFLFQGCDGNANNFPIEKACMEYCSRPELRCASGGDYHRQPNGLLTECSLRNRCPSGFECSRTSSHGNSKQLCCPTKLHICQQRFDEGRACGQTVQRYQFDSNLKQCRLVTYLGCGGNSNNFPSAEACRAYCLSAACASAEVVLTGGTIDSAHDCSRTSCPSSYSCVRDVWNTTNMVCCGTPSRDVCPDDFIPFINPLSLAPLPCTGYRQDVCPAGFHCLPHPSRKRYYCCGKAMNQGSCPFGTRLLRLRTGDPFGCNGNSPCPPGAICQQADATRSGICCRSIHRDAKRLDLTRPEIALRASDVTSHRRAFDCPLSSGCGQCFTSQRRSCPSSYFLRIFSLSQGRYLCCRRTSTELNNCVRRLMEGAEAIFCSSSKPCPGDYHCVRPESDRSGVCCPLPVLSDSSREEKRQKLLVEF
ncbi:hypothetical protein Q1695_013967 [Nippostrongylus brasiliensis]|nr:hypothetical protein Q1695_013967 [Nippostrongylus brasiliensis]